MRDQAAAEPMGPSTESDGLDLLGRYLAEISRTPLLTAEQEVLLARRIEAGLYADHLLTEYGDSRDDLQLAVEDGRKAKEHMIRANLRLVVSVARRYPQQRMSLLDLIQEGNLGLIHAVEKFDYTRGIKFSTYSVWWIRQSIQRALSMKSRTIRLPLHVIEKMTNYARIERTLALRLGREATAEEVAAEAGQPVAQVTRTRLLAQEAVSLDVPVGSSGEEVLGDVIEDDMPLSVEDLATLNAMWAKLRSLIERLPAHEAQTITLRYGLRDGAPQTLRQIGDLLGFSQEYVRTLEKQALTKLRSPHRLSRPTTLAGLAAAC